MRIIRYIFCIQRTRRTVFHLSRHCRKMALDFGKIKTRRSDRRLAAISDREHSELYMLRINNRKMLEILLRITNL